MSKRGKGEKPRIDRAGEVIDAATGKPEGAPPSKAITAAEIPLLTALDVRREQSRVYREARGGTIEKQDAAKLIWMLDRIRESIATQVAEERIAALEEALEKRIGKPAALPVRPH